MRESDIPSFSAFQGKSASYYDRNIKSYSESNKNPAEFIDEFLGYLKETKGKVVLDLGSGPGINAAYIHARGCQVVGIDLSEKMVEYARSRYPGMEFQLGDMTKLPFEENTFDGIFASYSLIHLTKQAVPSVLAKLSEILRPGGIIYISVQSGQSTQGFYSHPLIPDDKIFLNIFSKDEICKLLSDHQFEVLARHEMLPEGKVFNFTKLFVVAGNMRR